MCLYHRALESFCTLHKHKYGSQEDVEEEASKEDIKQMIFLLVLKSDMASLIWNEQNQIQQMFKPSDFAKKLQKEIKFLSNTLQQQFI